jgi:two-component system sensor histidine kinase YesM
MLNYLKTFYSNLRIKHKVFLLITFVLLAFSIGGWSVMQYAFNVYNDEIYRQSAQALGVTSNGIENELKKMEKLSFRISTDPSIQSQLLRIKNSDSAYEKFLVGTSLQDRMLEIGGLEKYVLSLQMLDEEGKEFAIGNKKIVTPLFRINQIQKEAKINQGGNRWIFPYHLDSALISAREVRLYTNLDLASIGTLAVRIDLENIFADISRGMNKKEAAFIILNGEEVVYPDESHIDLSALKKESINHQGYKFMEINGDRFFVTYAPSYYTDWTYMIVTPYNSLFEAILSVQRAVLIVFAGLFVIVMYFALRFAKGITGPIEGLNQKMKKVQMGNFDYEDEEKDRHLPMDEAGQMHRNFRMMLEHINELITENYKKQLAIKESEFKALQAQINPHFLYNTLESINWSAKVSRQYDISQMVEALGYILRTSISSKEPLVTIEEELKMVKNYITIQKFRFEERLDFQTDISTSLYSTMIPKLTLQPLVENAIRYGLEQIIGTCTIHISCKVEQHKLILTVRDDGPGMEPELLEKLKNGVLIPKGTGIGIKNIDERIRLLFGDLYGISVESKWGEGTVVYITLPYEGDSNHV